MTAQPQFNKGDTVYSLTGEEAEYVMSTGFREHVVKPIYDNDGEPYYDKPTTWEECFSVPPKQRLHTEVEGLEAKKAELDLSLRQLRTQIATEERNVKTRLESLKKYEALELVEDYLEGRITHVVVGSYYNDGRFDIHEMGKGDTVSNSDSENEYMDGKYRRPLKLISLFGSSKKTLEWKMNYYSDGSGSSVLVYPCTSFEQAVEKIAGMLETVYSEWRKNPSQLYKVTCAVESARKYSIPVPEDVTIAHEAHAKVVLEKHIAELEKNAREATERLAKAKGEA